MQANSCKENNDLRGRFAGLPNDHPVGEATNTPADSC